MIKAVVFDCFGVLVRDGWLPFCEKHFGNDVTLRERGRENNRRVNTGLITYNDYIRENAKIAGISEDQAREEIESNPPNDELFAVIRDQLKPQYKIGLLSNAGENWLEDLFGKEQVALFDEIALSYEMGATKPDAITYETIAARLGVLPEECIFVDDQERFCVGAEAVGMKAIYYRDNEQLISKLKDHKIIR
jgi:HAD superfamily hydrolase (TIGR01509 family)